MSLPDPRVPPRSLGHWRPLAGQRYAAAIAIGLVTIALLTLALSINLLPRVYEVRQGDVASFNVRAPRQISYVSQLQTRAARDAAAAQVQPVVQLDYDLIGQQRSALAALLRGISAARSAPGLSVDQRQTTVATSATPPLDAPVAQQIVSMDDRRWADVSAESDRLLADVMRDRISTDDLSTAQQSLPLRISPTIGDSDRPVVVALTQRYVTPNLLVNQEATAKAVQQAEDSVEPIVQTYERGQTVVQDGQVIGPVELEALDALGLRTPEVDWQSVGAAALLALLVVGMLGSYLWHFGRDIFIRQRRMLLLAAILVLVTTAAKMVILSRPLWVYVFPLPMVSMLLAILLEPRLAIMVGILLSTVVAWIAGGSLEVGLLGVVGCTVGALATYRRERIGTYFLAGIAAGAVQMVAYLAFFLSSRADDWSTIPLTGFELGVNGVLSSLLAVGSVVIVGRLFGILTPMQLLELASPTQPLLRRLLMEAPGTYHHSIMVGNLAERAADVVGADSLLVRVAAYYHDIGKLERPWMFIENQQGLDANIHNTLAPEVSAQFIAAHVVDGVKLAEKAGLPPRVREMIPQHHGTRLISFFYQQACEQTEDAVDPCAFVYPGPRPQTREAAILMLADSTEAAARAARDHSRQGIQDLVEALVRQRLEEGQFDDCQLTLQDLTRIKQSFVTLLAGIYHERIPYPPAPNPSPHADPRVAAQVASMAPLPQPVSSKTG